jgi:regulator of cell morphogenesis and NO signaling
MTMHPASTTHEPEPNLVDVRSLAPRDRDAALLTAFDRLAPSETLLLVSAGPPRELLELLRKERKGLFEWTALDRDAGPWQVAIGRRTAVAGAGRRVTEALERDHDRLDGLLQRAMKALRVGHDEAARAAYNAFRRGLCRHIRFEEELLFPVFEMRTGLPHGGPTSVLRAEHRQIEALLGEIGRALEEAPSTVEDLCRALRDALADHNRKEELILYPGTDRLLTEAQSDALVARIQSYSS